jgi:hypothetical protein
MSDFLAQARLASMEFDGGQWHKTSQFSSVVEWVSPTTLRMRGQDGKMHAYTLSRAFQNLYLFQREVEPQTPLNQALGIRSEDWEALAQQAGYTGPAPVSQHLTTVVFHELQTDADARARVFLVQSTRGDICTRITVSQGTDGAFQLDIATTSSTQAPYITIDNPASHTLIVMPDIGAATITELLAAARASTEQP